ncbi:MAG: oligosaccharide flippase family protein, partial [Bacteroidia bacterium]|nr:oligosaccharide flippase family protein [Bacteroidia bacterium]
MIKRLFPTSEFTKNIFTLLTGTTLAQLLAIAAYPILTRLFTPEDFGVFALYLGITGIASIAISGRYELAVMLPKSDDDSIHIVLGSVLIAFISSIGLFIFFYFSNTYIANLLNSPKLADWILLMPIPIFMIGTYKSINNWLIRKKAFKKSSSNKFAQSGTYASGGISLGWFNISGGLIIADILAKVAINIVGTIQMFNTQFTLRQISIAKIKENLIRYSDFPKYNIIPALMDTGSLMIPYFFINSFYSEEITGYVNLTKQIAYAPLALISISVSRVLFETLASKKNNSEPVFKYVISLFYRLGGIALLYV